MNFKFKANVVKGEGRGRKIGLPTANLDKLNLPLNFGVYKVKVILNNKEYLGLLHYGFKKTFNNIKSTELLIKGFNQDIYGAEIIVEVIKKIREIKKFKNKTDFKKQIKKDLTLL